MSRTSSALSALDLSIFWGDKLLMEERLCPPRRYVIGDGSAHPENVDFAAVLPANLGSAHVLIDVAGDGIRICPPGAATRTLAMHESCEVKISDLTFRMGVSSATALPAVPHATKVDRRSLGWFSASLSVHALFFLCMAWMPPKASSLSLERERADDLAARYLLTPKQVSLELETTPIDAREEPKGSSSPAAKGPIGQAGMQTREPEKRRARPAARSSGPLFEQVRSAGILGALSSWGEVEISSPYVVDAPMDDAAALGLFGAEVGSTFGYGGLTMRDTGRGGGGDADGVISVGGLDTKGAAVGVPSGVMLGRDRKSRVPVVAHENGASIKGSLSKEVIRREIQRHMNEVRFCYEQALQHAPDLHGRLTVRFLIGKGGAVMAASVESSSLGNDRVEECVTQALRRWTFPRPENDGYVTVSYPFLFQSAQ